MTRAYATFETDRRVCRAAAAWMDVPRHWRRSVIASLELDLEVAVLRDNREQCKAFRAAISLLRSTRAWGTP
jgi:hypothetical protein